jgi:hypothetical protein
MMKNSRSAPGRSGLLAGILISKTCPPEAGLYEPIKEFFIILLKAVASDK